MDKKHSYPEKTIEAFEVAAANGAIYCPSRPWAVRRLLTMPFSDRT